MKRLLLLAVLMVAATTVTAQDLKLADRVIRVDDVYEGYKLVSARCGRIDMGFGDTPPVAGKYYPEYNASEKWTLYPTDAGTFRRIVIEFIGEWYGTLIDDLFAMGYRATSDRRENYWIMGQPVPWRVIRMKKGNVVVKFIDPHTAPSKTGIMEGDNSVELYGGDAPIGDFIVEFIRTN